MLSIESTVRSKRDGRKGLNMQNGRDLGLGGRDRERRGEDTGEGSGENYNGEEGRTGILERSGVDDRGLEKNGMTDLGGKWIDQHNDCLIVS